MDEYEMLQKHLHKIELDMSSGQRAVVLKAVALWGGRLHQSTQELAAKLDRQLAWLDQNIGDVRTEPEAHIRESEWLESLAMYERSCRLLAVAEGVL